MSRRLSRRASIGAVRNPESDRAILEAARALLEEKGLRGVLAVRGGPTGACLEAHALPAVVEQSRVDFRALPDRTQRAVEHTVTRRVDRGHDRDCAGAVAALARDTNGTGTARADRRSAERGVRDRDAASDLLPFRTEDREGQDRTRHRNWRTRTELRYGFDADTYHGVHLVSAPHEPDRR